MTLTQQIITVAMVVLGTAVTRFLPFLLFPAGRTTPKYVQYLGKVLPAAVFGLLVPRHTGADLDRSGYCAPCVETADASVYCRRDSVLYAACSACILASYQSVELIKQKRFIKKQQQTSLIIRTTTR